MKYFKDKAGWEHHWWFKWPTYQFWGLMTIMLMLADFPDGWIFQIIATLFLIQGISRKWKSKTTVQK